MIYPIKAHPVDIEVETLSITMRQTKYKALAIFCNTTHFTCYITTLSVVTYKDRGNTTDKGI